MTASDLYELFVGEIGIPRREFLYDISLWEARRIYRGYRKRYRDLWSAARWHAYRIMGAIPYVDLQKNGIFSPADILPLPWDKAEVGELPSDEEIDKMRKELQEENNAIK